MVTTISKRAIMARITGFTLVELMVTIAVLAIVVTVGVPSFQSSIANKRLSAGANDFVSALQFAKTNALTTNATTTMCTKKANEEQCDPAGFWSNGWLVFLDVNANGKLDGSETILSTHDRLHSSLSLSVSADLEYSIRFRPNGLPDISSAQDMVLCDERGFSPQSKAILISVGGRGSVMDAADLNKTSCS
jgi:type IV fimbrial biogenesis protein FimT